MVHRELVPLGRHPTVADTPRSPVGRRLPSVTDPGTSTQRGVLFIRPRCMVLRRSSRPWSVGDISEPSYHDHSETSSPSRFTVSEEENVAPSTIQDPPTLVIGPKLSLPRSKKGPTTNGPLKLETLGKCLALLGGAVSNVKPRIR
jgi:hypothetical protein